MFTTQHRTSGDVRLKSAELEMATLKVLTLNVWGLHYLAQKIRVRLEHIAEEIKQYDIVGLQEVWSKNDYEFLVDQLKLYLPYSHHFHRGILGSGLCVFSRHPIVSAHSHQFNVNGSLTEISDGEIFVGKGIMLCRVSTPQGIIAFYNTHTNPRNRDSQLFEIYQFVDQTRANLPVILTGDFNTKPTHLAYSVLTDCLRLKDVYTDNPVDTCDLTSNIFTEKRMTPKRIDFVLYSDELSPTCSMELKGRQLALSGHIPGQEFPYSDHEGVEATLQLSKRTQPYVTPEVIADESAMMVFLKLTENMEKQKAKFQTTPSRIITTFVLLFLFCVTVTFALSNHTLFLLLSSYNLQWMVTCVVGVVCTIAMVIAIGQFSNISVLNALEANLSEIETLLLHLRAKRSKCNGIEEMN